MRKRKPKLRIPTPDPRYGDPMVTQFVNMMMYQGKKGVAFKTFYDAMDIIKERTGEDEHAIWKKALNTAMPQVEVRSKRVGGATFQVPLEVRPERKINLGIKWMIGFARKRNEKTMVERLAGEIMAASKGEGAAVKKKDDTHRMAEANKAFSHFRL